MERQIREVRISYAEYGRGTPLVALHGAGVDHREMESAIEPLLPQNHYRRIYPDLPGMGASTAEGLTSNTDVVHLLGDFLRDLDAGPVLLLGHSYGAYLAREIAATYPSQISGLALLCPIVDGAHDLPTHGVIRQDPDAYDELEPGDRGGFDEYFVIRTRATARRYRDAVLPGTKLGDAATLERIFRDWPLDLPT
ncbi:alpha/beta fold hydrolase [Mycetocola zhadangensis]|uniref:alpha/beta fold hydrolase n=1 Tax=Mycetocola zhadangensis TaxID=1164595 RepID=UPI003A4E04A1